MSIAKGVKRGSHRGDRYNYPGNTRTPHGGSERNDCRPAYPINVDLFEFSDYDDPSHQFKHQYEWRQRHQFPNIFDSAPTDPNNGSSKSTGKQAPNEVYSNAVTLDGFRGLFALDDGLFVGPNATREKTVFPPVNSALAADNDARRKDAQGKGKSSVKSTQSSHPVDDGKAFVKQTEPTGAAIPPGHPFFPTNAGSPMRSIDRRGSSRKEASSSTFELRVPSPPGTIASNSSNRLSEVRGNHSPNVAATAVKEGSQPLPQLIDGKCSICKIDIQPRQGDKFNWERHVKDVHLNQRDYECPICSHCSNRKNNIAQHIRDMHLGYKPIQSKRKSPGKDKHPATVKCSWCSKEFAFNLPSLVMDHFTFLEGQEPSECLLAARAAASQTSS